VSYSKLNHPLEDRLYRQIAGNRLLLVFLIAFLGLGFRLFYLQIINGSYHEKLSLQNSVRVQVVKAPRGLIYDSRGQVIARNRPSYQIAILPTQIKNSALIKTTLNLFVDSLGKKIFDSNLVNWTLDRAKWKKFKPLVILEDATMEIVAQIEEHQLEIPGVTVVVESRRAYPYGKSASHVLGYMDEVKEDELQVLRKSNQPEDSLLYQRGDRIGRKGLERIYERPFRGRDGVRYVKVNAFGKVIEPIAELPEIKAQAGQDLWTTLDMELQAVAESCLTDTIKGSVVVMDPRNGNVLVMASTPRMDGNIFSLNRDKRNKEWAKLVFDPNRPLTNRAVAGGYEPGSTYKVGVSLAALESGRIQAHDHMPRACVGGYRFGSRFWRCWDPKGHGFTDMYSALMQSCDGYFYQAGLIVGLPRINDVARRLGLGKQTGIDLDDERSGELIDSISYETKFKKRGWHWTPGLALNLAIGQGQIVTPLQLCLYAAGLAQGKYLFQPHFINSIKDSHGHTVLEFKPKVMHEVGISEENHKILMDAMYMVVSGPKGTGGRARVDSVKVGGKTGSAENPHGDKTHALFIGMAPIEAPEIVVAVIMENVGHGGSFAAPVAGEILRRYFSRKTRG
jgi:penicillin-binding protein 2